MMLPVVEWGFIFLPILFHTIIGVMIIRGGLPNSGTYRYANNVRYTLQRASGMIALLYIFWHVFHMHGWFHMNWWMTGVVEPLGGALFKPYNAASSLGAAMNGFVVPLLYAIGLIACVFHLANGIWTMGITWGWWITPAAQRRANVACAVFGVGLLALSMTALTAAITVDEAKARDVEDRMFQAKVQAGELDEHTEKRWPADHVIAPAPTAP
jgi:succinate dehydrogenase / fumarate reductase, cytochrome b subunit